MNQNQRLLHISQLRRGAGKQAVCTSTPGAEGERQNALRPQSVVFSRSCRLGREGGDPMQFRRTPVYSQPLGSGVQNDRPGTALRSSRGGEVLHLVRERDASEAGGKCLWRGIRRLAGSSLITVTSPLSWSVLSRKASPGAKA